MPRGWVGSDRRSRLPNNWAELVTIIKARAGGQCEQIKADGQRCTNQGTDVDHINRGDDHSLDNLQLLCHWPHHARKTASEGNQARNAVYAKTKRPQPKHPGIY